MKKFYVYEHWRPDKNECFYVGKGCGLRASDLRRRNHHHKSIQAKLLLASLEVQIYIIKNFLTENEAFDLEKYQISLWRSKGVKLTNVTEGGGIGISGPFSEDHLKSLRTANASAEARSKKSAAAKSRWADPQKRLKWTAGIRAAQADPRVRERISKGVQKRWDDPTFRSKMNDIYAMAQEKL